MCKEKTFLFTLLLFFSLAVPLPAATYWVLNTFDSGPGSLRQAMIDANTKTKGVHDIIRFNIQTGVIGVKTIMPLSQLPPLTDWAGVTIDGFTQAGASPGSFPPATATLMVEVNGIKITTGIGAGAHGFWLQSDGNIIQGLVINNFPWDGIRIEGTPADPMHPTANNNHLFCNFIGTDPSGFVDMGNGQWGGPGLFFAGAHILNQAGGTSKFNLVEACLSSGNWSEGVWIEGPREPGDVGHNHVFLSYIGTDITGASDLGNDHVGVALTEGAHDNQIFDNIISGNDFHGVSITGFDNLEYYPAPPIQSHHNTIFRNIIGLSSAGDPLPNSRYGVSIGKYDDGKIWGCADHNTTGPDNIIAFNKRDGIAIFEFTDPMIPPSNGDHNQVTQNSIFQNTELGIDLNDDGVTPNDPPWDLDPGPNQRLNFPIILSVVYNPNTQTTVIAGELQIDSNPLQATIEVFRAQVDPSGHGEGDLFLGSTTPHTYDSTRNAGYWNISITQLFPGDYVTTTATDIFKNTSEFGPNAFVPGALTTSISTLSRTTHNTVTFYLDSGSRYAGRDYLLLGTMSGTSPGTFDPATGLTLPLNWDPFTGFVYMYANSQWFQNFLGTLDSNGRAAAVLDPAGLPLPPVGQWLHFTYMLLNPADLVSSPVGIQIIP